MKSVVVQSGTDGNRICTSVEAFYNVFVVPNSSTHYERNRNYCTHNAYQFSVKAFMGAIPIHGCH